MTLEFLHDADVWDRFIGESPNGTLFHRWSFLKIIEKYTGYRLYPCGIRQGEELLGVIPFFLRVQGGFRKLLSPPPIPLANVPYLGFAMSPRFHELQQHDKIRAWDYLVRETHRGLRPLSPNYLFISQTSDICDARPFEWEGYEIEQQYTYVLDLRRPLQEIWEGFDRDCRKNINECKKYPLSLKQVSDVDGFNRLMKDHLATDELTFYHRRTPDYLRELLEAFPQNIKLYYFFNGDEVVGGKINMGYKKHYMSWMGNVSVQKELSTNEFFYWELIKRAREEGYLRHENFGTNVQRLNLFKSKFNPSLEPCFYAEKTDGPFKVASFGSRAVAKIIGR